jgi:hypothetical protein
MPTAEQQTAIKYFKTPEGCIGTLLNMLFGVSDETYDAMVSAKRQSYNPKQKALNKIGLDESQVNEIPPVNFEGYDFEKSNYVKKGKDNRWRSSRYQTTWLFFSDAQVYMYSYAFNLDSDEKNERTEEYFYKDIVNFSTASDTVDKAGQKVESHRFKLVVPGDQFSVAMTGDAESVLQAMKQKLREKKR